MTHYSYFGSFRSFTSNVGINVAMLNSHGKLTDIGGWYLYGNGTGVKPDNITVKATVQTNTKPHSATYTVPSLATTVSWGVVVVPNLMVVLGAAVAALYLPGF